MLSIIYYVISIVSRLTLGVEEGGGLYEAVQRLLLLLQPQLLVGDHLGLEAELLQCRHQGLVVHKPVAEWR